MEEVSKALYTALRDDSEANVGIRALLGNTTTTPYNVYHAFLPEAIDFSQSSGNKGFITYQFISGTPDITQHSRASMLSEDIYQFIAYHRNLSTVEDIHRRIKKVLQQKRKVTDPTTQAVIHEIKLDSEGPSTFDNAFKVWFQSKFYRVWVRDDDI